MLMISGGKFKNQLNSKHTIKNLKNSSPFKFLFLGDISKEGLKNSLRI
jgi:hypothetical protein